MSMGWIMKLVKDYEKAINVLLERIDWLDENNINVYSTWNKNYVSSGKLKNIYGDNFYVLYDGHEIVAAASLCFFDVWEDWVDKKEAIYIGKMATPLKYRGKGYAKKMIEAAKEFGIAQGVDRIRLEVFPELYKIIEIYKECGFKFVKEVVWDSGNVGHFYECKL